MTDLAALYEGRPLRAGEIAYKDYAVWQQEYLSSDSMKMQRSYWQEALSGELPLLNLHTDNPRGAVQTFTGARIGFEIGSETTNKLRAFAAIRGTTMYMLALAVYNVLLSKYTGQEDIIVGTPVAGRHRREVQDVAGVFINTLPLRNAPRGDLSFAQFLAEVAQRGVSAFAQADCPFERMLADLQIAREPSRNPLFDTMLMYAKDTFRLKMGGVDAELYPLDPGVAKLDLTLELYDSGDSLKCQLEYNTDLYRESTVRRMISHLVRLFTLLTDAPDTRLSDVSVLSKDELWQVTRGFNQTDIQLPDISVQSLLEDLAESQPKKTAVISDGKSLSFAQLNARANRIAHVLRSKGVGRNVVVALCLARSVDLMAAIFGVLKAGGGYLPIDMSYPPDRITFMLSDSGAKVLLSDGSIDAPYDGETVRVQDITGDGPDGNLERVDGQEDIAYVMYTSGSTGLPKGTVLKRRNLLNFYEGVKGPVDYRPEQTSVSITTVSFDIFVCDALLPLLFGATLVLCTEDELRQPHLLAALIRNHSVRFIEATPTRMRIMLEDPEFCRTLSVCIEKIMLGGEPVPMSLVEQLRELTDARIINAFGPTETTVYSSFKELTHAPRVTIGRPIANTRFYMLDKYRRPVPVGVLGEGYISGAGVAAGYIGRDELNKKTFLPDPFWPGQMMYKTGDLCAFLEDGEMVMCGRIDHQIKIRGQRIELGEIEAAIRAYDGVDEAVVKDWGAGVDKYLCAYLASEGGVDTQALRAYLLKKLPAYMVPSFFVTETVLPTTLNGKVNRKALLEPDRTQMMHRNAPAGEMTDTEKKMADVWARILHTGAVGPDDNFLELGGDSLSAIKIQTAVLQYGWTIRMQDFFDLQTLRKICAALGEGVGAGAADDSGMEDLRGVAVPEYTHLKRPAMKHILLTGATGYLGAHLLEQIAQTPNADIYCLVRGSSDADCRQYLHEVLSFYFGSDAHMLMRRINVVRGDVSQSGLGMSGDAAAALGRIDTVIHSAAITDHIGAAERFLRTNVTGTRGVTAFAQSHGAALLHISTVSVAGTRYIDDEDRRGTFTETDYYVGQNYAENVYTKSKFLAEDIVLRAIGDGLNARIFRVGVLTGTLDGHFQMRPERNAFAGRIRALCELGIVPESIMNERIEMTPVDACVQAILTLAALEMPRRPIYHVYNTNVIDARSLVALLGRNGYRIDVVSDDMFMAELARRGADGDHMHVGAIMADLDAPHGGSGIEITADITQTLLEQKGFHWPEIDAEYMARFVRSITTRAR